MTTQTRMIAAGDLEVGYIDAGSGAPLILIHGAESDRNQFGVLREALGNDLRIISYDQRDTGVTVNPPTAFTADDLAADVVALMDALDIERAYALGTSYGGVIAQILALNHPDRLETVFFVATTPGMTKVSDAAAQMMTMSDSERREAMVGLLLTEEGRAANPELEARGRSVLSTRTPEQSARRMGVMREHNIIERLGEISVPVVVIHGTDDQLTPVDGAQTMADRIPGAELRLIEGGRHGIATEFPGQVAAFVREFIDEA